MTPEEQAAKAAQDAAAQAAATKAAQEQIEAARKATAEATAAAAKATAEAEAARKAREPEPEEDPDLKGLPKSVRDELTAARLGKREAEAAKAEAEARAAKEQAAFREGLAELQRKHADTETRLETERLERELVEAAPHVQAPAVRTLVLDAYKAHRAAGGTGTVGEFLASDAVTKSPIYGPLTAAPRNTDGGTTTVRHAPPIGRGARPGAAPSKQRVSPEAIAAAKTPTAFDAIAEDWRADLTAEFGRPVGSGGKRAKAAAKK
jgi:hypothetical protein